MTLIRARVASAGTGKTTSLVKRYLELVEEGTPLRRVAGVTFTRSAAEELRQRVAAGFHELLREGSYLSGLHAPGPAGLGPYRAALAELGGATITTIHGFMRVALRLNAPLLGLDPNFSQLPEWEVAALFEEELATMRYLASDPEHELHRDLLVAGEALEPLARGLFAKRSLAADLVYPDEPLSAALGKFFAAAYERLGRRLGGGSLGPGEVERAAHRLFASETMRARLVERFPVVLVDESQDVNPLQGRFFEQLAELGVALEVVGDPKQSIYGFRSADVGVFRRALDAAQSSGGLLPPLRESRRHSRALVAFLNRLTTRLAAAGLGFEPREAPEVSAAGKQATVAGSVRLLLAEGDVSASTMRQFEAAALATELERLHLEDGVSYDDMAVVAHANWLLDLVHEALRERGIPGLMLRGRELFDRLEVRDVRHALQVGVTPSGPSLGRFLRGPYAALGLADLAAVMAAKEPLQELRERRPDVAETIEQLRRIARLNPLEGLAAVVRAPLIAGRRYVDTLDDEALANVDAMLFELTRFPPTDLEIVLERLDDLAERSDAAAVPASGSGVKLSTIHASKGLEYDVVALFDTGNPKRDRTEDVLVDAETGLVSLRLAGTDDAAQRARRERDRHESFRLLYVAASRARDTLVLSGSVGRGNPRGWLEKLLEFGVDDLPGASVERLGWLPTGAAGGPPPAPREGLPSSPWVEANIAPHRHPPLSSPSRLVGLGLDAAIPELDDEPYTWAESLSTGAETEALHDSDDEGEATATAGTDPAQARSDGLPGRGRVIGTLVHFAISRDWSPDDEALAGLSTQEVMFPYSAEQREEILNEVRALLGSYRSLLGNGLAALSARSVDRAEIPLAHPGGATVWEGVIDRLYRTEQGWFIDDYKTDHVVRPERYLVQLGLYRQAVGGALAEAPRARLVYLRSGTIVEPDPAELDAALVRSGIAVAGTAARP